MTFGTNPLVLFRFVCYNSRNNCFRIIQKAEQNHVCGNVFQICDFQLDYYNLWARTYIPKQKRNLQCLFNITKLLLPVGYIIYNSAEVQVLFCKILGPHEILTSAQSIEYYYALNYRIKLCAQYLMYCTRAFVRIINVL